MNRKELQRQRMIGFFVSAAIELIDNEGVSAVSARRVAELAGYSYATIYNYFRDINHLLWHCLPEYVNRVSALMQPEVLPGPTGVAKLRQSVRAYAEFFLSHPESFRFMFMADLGEMPEDISQSVNESGPPFVSIIQRLLEQCAAEGSLQAADIPAVIALLTFTVNGALMFYINGRMEGTPEVLLAQLDAALSPLFQRSAM